MGYRELFDHVTEEKVYFVVAVWDSDTERMALSICRKVSGAGVEKLLFANTRLIVSGLDVGVTGEAYWKVATVEQLEAGCSGEIVNRYWACDFDVRSGASRFRCRRCCGGGNRRRANKQADRGHKNQNKRRALQCSPLWVSSGAAGLLLVRACLARTTQECCVIQRFSRTVAQFKLVARSFVPVGGFRSGTWTFRASCCGRGPERAGRKGVRAKFLLVSARGWTLDPCSATNLGVIPITVNTRKVGSRRRSDAAPLTN